MTREQKRTLCVAVLAIVMLAMFAVLRPQAHQGVPESTFWHAKFARQGQFDVVAAGDSRTLYAMNMEPFANQGLGDGLNFGFRGAAMDGELLTQASHQLNPDGKKIILLGITPNGFTANAAATNGFLQKHKEYEKSTFTMPMWWGSLLQRFEPVKLIELSRMVRGGKDPLQKEYHDDGWIASNHRKPNPQSALRFYQVRFDGNEALPELSEAACETIGELTGEGVQVFGFQPPIVDEMAAIEQSKSGFDYATFIEQFTAAGGVWIDVDSAKYETYDGSHLQGESAQRLSERLAEEIRQRIDGER